MSDLRSKFSRFKSVTSVKQGLLSSVFCVFLASGTFAQTQNTDETTIIEDDQLPKIITPAEEELPISLFPSEDDELFQEEIVEEENIEAAVENDALPGIVSEESLSSIDPATAGVLDDTSGGLGFDMWSDTDRKRMKLILGNLPTRIDSPSLQNLARRLLLTSADIPVLVGDSDTDIITDGVEILRLRVDQLMRLGHANTARQLILAAGFDEAQLQMFVETLLEISLLEHDYNQTCNLVHSQTDRLGEPFWQKHLIFCQLLEKNIEGAQFGATLLQDLGEDDPLFYALIERMVDQEAVLPIEPSPTALHLSMYQIAGVALPDVLLSSQTEPRLLKAIVDNPRTNINTRLNAAEQANRLGLISGETLAALYAAQPFTPEDLQSPISAAEEDYSSRTRALLYQVAVADPVPETRSILVAKALEFSKKANMYQMTLSAFSTIIIKMPISADIWEFSGEAARALYALGRPKPAQAWISHLSDQAIRNPEAEMVLLRLWALSRVASGDSNFVIDEETGRKAWSDYVSATVPDESEVEFLRRLNMTYGLLDALSRPAVSNDAWVEMAAYEGNMVLLSPNPAHLRLMKEAAYAGRRAETIGWILRLLGQVSAAQIAPNVMIDAIEALDLVGMRAEAQSLALETAMANGL